MIVPYPGLRPPSDKPIPKPKRIGVVLSVLNEHYQTTIHQGICETAFQLGYEVFCIQGGVLNESLDLVRKNVIFDAVRLVRLDGLIVLTAAITTSGERAMIRRLETLVQTLPAVSVGYPLGGLPAISIDNKHSFETILDHLLNAHGYRKILYLGGPELHADNQAREVVFCKTLEEAAAKYASI